MRVSLLMQLAKMYSSAVSRFWIGEADRRVGRRRMVVRMKLGRLEENIVMEA